LGSATLAPKLPLSAARTKPSVIDFNSSQRARIFFASSFVIDTVRRSLRDGGQHVGKLLHDAVGRGINGWASAADCADSG
jgi:hypothetical protein